MVPAEVDRVAVNKVLDESLEDDDFYCKKSRGLLGSIGLERDAVLKLLAQYKSSVKYAYDISPDTLSHLLALAKGKGEGTPLEKLVESPFFFVKACWLYEHAPYFFFYDEGNSEDRDSLILEFAGQYETRFLWNRVVMDTWNKVENPKRFRVTTFWESKILDPVLLVERAKNDNVEGLELCIKGHEMLFLHGNVKGLSVYCNMRWSHA